MEVDVEVGVEGPVGVVQTERDLDQAAAQRLEVDDRPPHSFPVVRVRVEVGIVGAIEEQQAVDVAEASTGLQVQEAGVET